MDHSPLKKLLVLLSCICVAGSAVITEVDDDGGRIVGGIETSIVHFPHQASLQYGGAHICGASVFSQRILITAAHCVSAFTTPQFYTVRVGSSESRRGGAVHAVQRIVPHESFNVPTTLNNDIALLVLTKPLTYSPSVQPISLMTPQDGNTVSATTPLFVSGWGATSSEVQSVALRLRYVTVTLQDQRNCFVAYVGAASITSTMFCAGDIQGGRDSCQGDSGGPLVTFVGGVLKLYGLVSWGISCAHPRYPGVYTRVPAYVEWVQQTAALYK